MANGFGSMYIGASGLQGAQNALNTTANNLANVNTIGYVRQQVLFTDKRYDVLQDPKTRVNMHQSGLGVSIGDVAHARDVFLDKAFRLEKGREAFYEECYESVAYVEDLFQELDGQEFKGSIEDLWVSFEELSKAPADSVNQNLVIQKAELLVSRCQTFYSDLESYQKNLNSQITDDVKAVNEIGNRIYELNLMVQKIESNDMETAMTLRDERDHLLDKLASYTNINVTEDATGFVYVEIDGVEFVDTHQCNNIDIHVEKGTGFATPYWKHLSNVEKEQYVRVWRTDGEISTETNTDLGSIKAKLLMRGDSCGRYTDLQTMEAYENIESRLLPETQAEVDLLFHEIITTMNDIFCPNVSKTVTTDVIGPDGSVLFPAGSEIQVLDEEHCAVGADGKLPPRELFVRAGYERYQICQIDGKNYYVYNEESQKKPSTMYTIGNVQINDELKKQVTLLPGFTQNGAADYELGQKIADAWADSKMHLNPSDEYPCAFQGFYDKIIGKLGTEGNTYFSAKETMRDTTFSIDNKRSQVTGVSSDEELTKMIKYQSAYNAASRYINVISQMTELIVTGLI